MTDEAMSPLRRRMIEDMTIRKFAPNTQHDLYEGLACQEVFSRSAFLFLPTFQEGSCERSSALMARQALCLAALSGQPPEPAGSRRKARGVDGESARRATMVCGHYAANVTVFLLILFPPLKFR